MRLTLAKIKMLTTLQTYLHLLNALLPLITLYNRSTQLTFLLKTSALNLAKN